MSVNSTSSWSARRPWSLTYISWMPSAMTSLGLWAPMPHCVRKALVRSPQNARRLRAGHQPLGQAHRAGQPRLGGPDQGLQRSHQRRHQRLNSHAIRVAQGAEPVVTDYVDAALAAQNGLVAAEAIGLGGVYLGSLRNHARALADLIGLPRYAYVVFGMAIGTPDPDRPSAIRPRPAQDVVLHRERYRARPAAEWVEDYEQAFKDFRAEYGLRDKTWSHAVAVGTSLGYMDGRENLRRTLEERGYLLG
ncbi:nitroreductase family protein [Streptomyces sp. NPDC090106]|uniref:nitroreductase family protein n=1 Tax=Streptomyces sp. NPDC090106 TaxID=3365946 RepID=UPI0037F3D5D9